MVSEAHVFLDWGLCSSAERWAKFDCWVLGHIEYDSNRRSVCPAEGFDHCPNTPNTLGSVHSNVHSFHPEAWCNTHRIVASSCAAALAQTVWVVSHASGGVQRHHYQHDNLSLDDTVSTRECTRVVCATRYHHLEKKNLVVQADNSSCCSIYTTRIYIFSSPCNDSAPLTLCV